MLAERVSLKARIPWYFHIRPLMALFELATPGNSSVPDEWGRMFQHSKLSVVFLPSLQSRREWNFSCVLVYKNPTS